jgi:MOSC domain-containing protein YiiM
MKQRRTETTVDTSSDAQPTISGRVEAIFTAPAAGAAALRRARVVATPGVGLQGDRYAAGIGHWSPDKRSGRDLTLIEAEVIDSLCEEMGLALDVGVLRRNVVTRGVRLNDLVGVRFRIGPLLVYGTRLCEPCEYLVQIVGAPLLAPLVHRGGLRVDVLSAGELVEGAEICLEQPTAI